MNQFNVRVAVLLEPVGTPDIVITCNGQSTEVILKETTWFDFSYTAEQGTGQLTVEHRNRHPHDGVTAVIVKSVTLNNIESPKIAYQGMYYPHDRTARQTDYVDWNGIWVLEYTVPVYTWLHKTLNLGWIYS